MADGDVRDLVSLQAANDEQLIIISKNNDRVQVIKTTSRTRNNPSITKLK